MPEEGLFRAARSRPGPFTAYVACCACGWTADAEHPPTEAGEDAALGDWAGHADQQQTEAQARCRQQLAETLRALGHLAELVDQPATLPRIARAASRAGELAAALLDIEEARR